MNATTRLNPVHEPGTGKEQDRRRQGDLEVLIPFMNRVREKSKVILLGNIGAVLIPFMNRVREKFQKELLMLKLTVLIPFMNRVREKTRSSLT